ncbi:MAG: DUF6876 family protein [Trueperaceae bacterium]
MPLTYPTTIDTSAFYGTRTYHTLTPLPVLATDGVAHLAKTADAFWLIDAIASHLLTKPTLREKGFAVISLTTREDSTADLVFDDGDGTVLSQQHLEFTDYPEPFRQFYAVLSGVVPGRLQWVIMLPSEY